MCYFGLGFLFFLPQLLQRICNFNGLVRFAVPAADCNCTHLVRSGQRGPETDNGFAPFELVRRRICGVCLAAKEKFGRVFIFQVNVVPMPSGAFQQENDVVLVVHENGLIRAFVRVRFRMNGQSQSRLPLFHWTPAQFLGDIRIRFPRVLPGICVLFCAKSM